jgi:mannosyltransferase OCH1-like enzyme
MRPKIYIPLILFFLLLCYLGTRIHAFVQLFFEHSGVAVTQLEAVAAHNSSKLDLRPQLIPKIIHQVFHDWKNLSSEVIPSDWDEVRQTCIDRNPDFEYRVGHL